MKAPLPRACVTRLRTFATEREQRGRRSLVQVCLVKSITSRGVSVGTIVGGLGAGGAGNLAVAHSSMTVCPCDPVHNVERRPTTAAAPSASSHNLFILDPPATNARFSAS